MSITHTGRAGSLRIEDNWLIYAACLLNLYLVVLMADSHHQFAWGTPALSGVLRGSVLILAAAFILQRADEIPRDPIILALGAYAAAGVAIGLLNSNPLQGITRHLFAACFMVTVYWAGTLIDPRSIRLVKTLVVLAWVTATMYVVILIVAPRIIGLAGASLAPQPAMIIIATALGSASIPLLLIGFALVLVGNKRSFALGVCASVALAGTIKSGVRPLWLKGVVLAVLFVLSLATYLLAAKYGAELGARFDLSFLSRIDGQLATVAARELAEPIRSGQTDFWTYITSGRNREFFAVLDTLDGSVAKWLFGAGFGATYEWTYYSWVMHKMTTVTHNQPDMVPSYFLMTGGIVFAIALIALIIWRVLQVAIFATSDRRIEVMVPALFVFGWAVDNFWSFAPNTGLFWLMLGFLTAQAQRHAGREPAARP